MIHRALPRLLPLLALATSLPAANIPITGLVLGPDGEPQARAEVVLEPIPSAYERARRRLEGHPGAEPVDSTRTDAAGVFELAAPEVGMWAVVVSSPGALTMESRLVPLVDAVELPVLSLVPAKDLEVRVADPEGRALPGTIGAFTLGVGRQPWRPQLRLADLGAEGVARLPLGRGERIQLEVLAEGRPLLGREVAGEGVVEIEVPAGVAGTVRVTGRRRPLPQAVVYQGSALLPLGATDDEGRLPLVLQADRSPPLQVMTRDRWSGSFELDLGAAADRGAEVEELPLDPPVTLRGRVLDIASRDPVPGAFVWVQRGEVAVTDRQGGYALDVGARASRWVQAAAAGYRPGHGGTAAQEEVTIALVPAASLSGRVVDPEGHRLPGVAIAAEMRPVRGQLDAFAFDLREGLRGRSSRTGSFTLRRLPAGVAFRLAFQAAGFAPQTLEVEPLAPFESRAGLEVVLRPGRIAAGWVVDEAEAPVAGAEVRLRPQLPADDMAAVLRRARGDEAGGATHLTDAEGRFEIADLAIGRYDLEISARGFAPAKVPGLRVGEGSGRIEVGTVVLVPGVSIEGRVSDSEGRPLAEAEITPHVEGGSFFGFMGAEEPRDPVSSDSEGRFAVAGLLPGRPVTLAVSKPGFGSETVRSVRPPTSTPVEVVLLPAARVEGRVVDDQGDGIEGAHVMVSPDPRAMTMTPGMIPRMRRPAWALSDAEGRFAIEDVQPGLLEVRVRAASYQEHLRAGFEVAPGAERQLEIVLERGAVVQGRLTTADGEPVVQASISVVHRREGPHGDTRGHGGDAQTDPEGRYRTDGIPVGTASISVRHAGRQRLEKVVEVGPGVNVYDLVIERGFDVSGQVVGPDGTPIGGVSLGIAEASESGPHVRYGPSEALSAADGTFELSDVAAGRYVLTASREGYAATSSEPFEVADHVSGLLLDLELGALLRGRLLGLEFDELGSLSLTAFGEGGMRRGQVDYSAEYRFEGLAPGRWNVQAQVAGSGRMAMLQVEIPEGVSEVEKDIDLGSGFTLTGVVLDGGQPLAGASVMVIGSMTSMGRAATDGGGRFRIESLEAGSYQVMVMSGLGVQHAEPIELVADHDMRIEISTGSVSGMVRNAVGGEPLSGASVALEPLDAGEAPIWSRQLGVAGRAESDSRGFFTVPQVRQGRWRVVVTKAGFGPGEAAVTVTGDSAPEVEIRLAPTDGIVFGVTLGSGAPLPTVHVAVLDPSGRRLTAGTYPVVEGKVRISTVPPGRWELVIQGGDSAATRIAVAAPGPQGDVVLPTGATLELRVPDLAEEPLATVALTGPDGRPYVSPIARFGFTETIMTGGHTIVSGLTPGVWSFTVQHEDGRTWHGSASVAAGATTEVGLP